MKDGSCQRRVAPCPKRPNRREKERLLFLMVTFCQFRDLVFCVAAVESTITWLKVSIFVLGEPALAGVKAPFSCQDPGAEASLPFSLPRPCKQGSCSVDPGTLFTALEAKIGTHHSSCVPGPPSLLSASSEWELVSLAGPFHFLPRQDLHSHTVNWGLVGPGLLSCTIYSEEIPQPFWQVKGTLFLCLYPFSLCSGNLGG